MAGNIRNKNQSLSVPPDPPDEIVVLAAKGLTGAIEAVNPKAIDLWEATRKQTLLDLCGHFQFWMIRLIRLRNSGRKKIRQLARGLRRTGATIQLIRSATRGSTRAARYAMLERLFVADTNQIFPLAFGSPMPNR